MISSNLSRLREICRGDRLITVKSSDGRKNETKKNIKTNEVSEEMLWIHVSISNNVIMKKKKTHHHANYL